MGTRTAKFWNGFRPFADEISHFTALPMAQQCVLFQSIDGYLKQYHPCLHLHMMGNKVVLSVWRQRTYFPIAEKLVWDVPPDMGVEVEALVPSGMDRTLYLECAQGTDVPLDLFGVPVAVSSLYCALEPDGDSPGQFIVTVFHPELYGLTEAQHFEQLGVLLEAVVGERIYGTYFSQLLLSPIVRNRTAHLIPMYRLVGDFWWEG